MIDLAYGTVGFPVHPLGSNRTAVTPRNNASRRRSAIRPDVVSLPNRRYNPGMGKDAAELLHRALQLPEAARAALADSLLASLDHEVDEDAEDAWREEIRRRIVEIDNGSAQLVPWEDVEEAVVERLQR